METLLIFLRQKILRYILYVAPLITKPTTPLRPAHPIPSHPTIGMQKNTNQRGATNTCLSVCLVYVHARIITKKKK